MNDAWGYVAGVAVIWGTAGFFYLIRGYVTAARERDDYREKYFAAKWQLYKADIKPLSPDEVWGRTTKETNEVKLRVEQQVSTSNKDVEFEAILRGKDDDLTPAEKIAAQEVEDIIYNTLESAQQEYIDEDNTPPPPTICPSVYPGMPNLNCQSALGHTGQHLHWDMSSNVKWYWA